MAHFYDVEYEVSRRVSATYTISIQKSTLLYSREDTKNILDKRQKQASENGGGSYYGLVFLFAALVHTRVPSAGNDQRGQTGTDQAERDWLGNI